MMSEQDMENFDSNENSDHDLIFIEILEDIHDKSQTHPNITKKETIYEICDCIRRKDIQWKGALKDTRSMGKVYTRCLVRL